MGAAEFAPDNKRYSEYSLSFFLEKERSPVIALWAGAPHLHVDRYGCPGIDGVEKMLRKDGRRILCYQPEAYGYSLCGTAESPFTEAALSITSGAPGWLSGCPPRLWSLNPWGS